MELTEKAKKEIATLQEKIQSLNNEYHRWNSRIDETKDWQLTKLYRKEQGRISDKIYKIENKIGRINADCISTSELTSLKKESEGFTTIKRKKSLDLLILKR